MSSNTVDKNKDSITYFQPLKEDSNVLNSSSSVLQFVYNLFNPKRGNLVVSYSVMNKLKN